MELPKASADKARRRTLKRSCGSRSPAEISWINLISPGEFENALVGWDISTSTQSTGTTGAKTQTAEFNSAEIRCPGVDSIVLEPANVSIQGVETPCNRTNFKTPSLTITCLRHQKTDQPMTFCDLWEWDEQDLVPRRQHLESELYG